MKKTVEQVVFKITSILLLLSLLSSCTVLFGRDGFFRDRGDDYLKAEEIPPMQVPDGLDSGALTELFVVPPVASDYVDLDREFEVPRPQALTKGDKAQVKIQKLDARRWLVVNSAPGIVWPRVKAFLASSQVEIYGEDPLKGEIETVWLKLENEPDSKDRYLLKIQPGLHNNSSEIFITQITVDARVPGAGKVNWPAHSMNTEREKWMLDNLAGSLAEPQEASVSLLAQSIGVSRRVEFVRPYQGEAFVLMDIDYDRAWASVSGALNTSAFELVSENRKEGYLTFLYDPDFDEDEIIEEPGFFDKVLGLDKKQQKKIEQRKTTYQMRLYQFNQKEVRVFCRDKDGKIPSAEEADKILYLVRMNLV